jgi:hypothetical protein
VATTRSRPPRGREHARRASGGPVAEHAGKIYGVAIGGAVAILAFLTLTGTGHVIDAAVQHFMLFYAGVFALIALCASVGLGLVATDRMVLGPGHRVFVQSAHRAASFAALAFLAVHIVTEILAQRVHVLDAFIPFLSPFRTFYIGLGTIASDLIILIVITSILRNRFTANGKAWKWRAIHYASYASFVFGIWHGLLGGRPAKPYVDWSYGFVVALVALGIGVRILSGSLRPKESLSSTPIPGAGTNSGFAPMRAVSMFGQLGMARTAAQGGTIAAAGAGSGRATGPMMAAGGARGVLTATGAGTGSWNSGSWNSGSWNSGPTPVAGALAAPVIADVAGPPSGPQPSYQPSPYEQPVYESGYDGPPRYRGARRHPGTGPQPQVGPGAMPGSRDLPRATSGPLPRAATGPLPRATSGPLPRAASGPLPRATSGPLPRAATGPLPAERGQRGPGQGGPMTRPGTGPIPQAGSRRQSPPGPVPGLPTGQGMPRGPRSATGPLPRAGTGPLPAERGQHGPVPGAPGRGGRGQGDPMTRAATGPMSRAGMQRQPPPAGPMPAQPGEPGWQAGPGAHGRPHTASGPYPVAGGPAGGRAAAAGVPPHPATAVPPGAATGPFPGTARGFGRGAAQGVGRGVGEPVRDGGYGAAPGAAAGRYVTGAGASWDAEVAGADPGLRYREPGPGMPGYRASRPRGTDPYAVNPYGVDLHDTNPSGSGRYGEGQYRQEHYRQEHYRQEQYRWDGQE